MNPTAIANDTNNTWLTRQVNSRAAMTPSKSMPSAGYRSLVLHMTEARVATGSPQVNEMPPQAGRASPALGMTTAALARELFHKRHGLVMPAKVRRKTPVSLKLTGNYRVITM
jgi:hypothetical protein